MVAVKDSKEVKSIKNFGLLYIITVAALVVACDVRDFLPIPSIGVVEPQEETVNGNPTYFEFDAKNWDIEAAGMRRDGAGYFVIILQDGCQTPGRLVPFEQGYVHLANGAYQAQVHLEPGTYEICVQVADGNHRALELSETVTIVVVK